LHVIVSGEEVGSNFRLAAGLRSVQPDQKRNFGGTNFKCRLTNVELMNPIDFIY
jgi:hypothetical protein